MKEPRSVFDFLRTKGGAVISQVSDELMKSPAFIRALETAYQGKERLNGAVGRALKTMNVPTRSEFKRAVARIEALERELADACGRSAKRDDAPPAPAAERGPAGRRTRRRRRKPAGHDTTRPGASRSRGSIVHRGPGDPARPWPNRGGPGMGRGTSPRPSRRSGPPSLLELHPAGFDQRLSTSCARRGRTVVHAAVLTNPRRDGSYAHELESIGTLNVLAAAAAAGVGHVVLRSFTAVYGAHGRNPAFLTEDRPLQPNLSLGWVRDKLEAEQHAASFARRYTGMKITVLRFAPLFGPGVSTFYTAIFDHRLVPVLMGYDPLVQLLHPTMRWAFSRRGRGRRASTSCTPGPPLLTALQWRQKCGTIRPIGTRSRHAVVGGLDAPAVHRFRAYPFLGDGRRRAKMGFMAATRRDASRRTTVSASAARSNPRAGA